MDLPQLRLDKWLWAARFFKTREQAIEAITGGKVHLNGQRTKPGKTLTPGDRLDITKEPYRWAITVKALDRQRRSAALAANLYEESGDSLAAREKVREAMQEASGLGLTAAHRPDKKDRRLIHRFKRLDTLD